MEKKVVKLRPLNLYLETSVFGFYFDELLHNRSKRVATRKLFEQIDLDLFI